MLLVLGVLPQILLLGDSIVEKTSFNVGWARPKRHMSGVMRVDGRVRGYVNGYIDAEVRGIIRGTMDATVSNASLSEADASDVDAETSERGEFDEEHA